MPSIAGNLERKPLSQVVREIHLSRSTGVLELQIRGQKRRLHFRTGELCLPGTHPLARKLAAGLCGPDGQIASGSLVVTRELKSLIARMVEVTAEWNEGQYVFLDDPASLPEVLVGPLPTMEFVMENAAARFAGREAIAAPGNDRTPWVADEGSPLRGRSSLFSPAELWVLERLRTPHSLRDLLAESPVGREELARSLVRLDAAGCVGPADRRSERTVEEPLSIVDRQVLERFDARIRQSLEERPVALAPGEHRDRLVDLLSRFAGLTDYELLGVVPSASIDEVHSAYERVTREVHPCQAEVLGLESARQGLQLLFERCTSAYLTLADPERRKAYDLEVGLDITVGRAAQPVAQRAQEQREFARQHHEQALAYATRGEMHFAIELLQLAVKADPSKSQYFLDLGRLQAKNPKWLRHAAESFRRAIELAPRDLGSRLLLADIYEKLEDPVRARVQYHTVLRIAPENPDAAAALERLEAAGGELGRGFLDRLFRR